MRRITGISTPGWLAAPDASGETVTAQSHGTSTSAVCRRFTGATAERLAERLSLPLGELRWLVCLQDAFGLIEHTILARLGVTADGTKVPLWVAERSTEHAAVCTGLLSDLAARGLDADKSVLFVVDGRLAQPRGHR